jgi:hypothetical protein
VVEDDRLELRGEVDAVGARRERRERGEREKATATRLLPADEGRRGNR